MPTKICEKKNFVVTLPSVKALILILVFNRGVSLNVYVVYKIIPNYMYLSVILVFNLVVVVTSTSVR